MERMTLAWTTCLVCVLAFSLHAFEAEHRETRELMAFVEDAAELVSASGPDGACASFREDRSRWRYEDDYVFILDMEGNTLCHPAQPRLEGRSIVDLRDPKGKPIVQMFLRAVEEDDEGWVHYQWPRPGESTFVWKSTYVKKATGPTGKSYVVGSGLYQMPMERDFVVEKVDEAVRLIEQEGTEALETLRDPAGGFRFYDAYVFVFDEAGVQHVNAAFPEHEGQNLLDLEDAEGVVIGREMLDVVRGRGAGWVDYLWPQPGDTRPSEKSSYVKGVQVGDTLYVVGAGVYF